MRVKRLLSIGLVLASCSTEPPAVSQGLKIFVTARGHGADFANDPYLTGANAIEKADAFCNSDPAKPSAATYKALLVNGVNRDAKTQVNWVLKPNTAYYRTHGDVLIGATTAAAIFGAAYQPLAHSIGEPQSLSDVWTGIANAGDFSAGEDCNNWSDATNFNNGRRAISNETSGLAFEAGINGCYFFQFGLYCVEQ